MPSTTTTTTTSQSHRHPHSTRPAHPRHRSASDPFVDPVYNPPYLTYVEDRLPRSGPLSAPPVPPKSSRKPRQYTDPRDPRMLEAAVRDSVTVRPVEPSPRAKIGRSHTGGVPSAAAPVKPPATTRRSYSQDSVQQTAAPMDKPTRSKGGRKKASTHTDFIDTLDPTSYGGPMFHHDGPFDACAPSRNKHKNRAPMLAWGSEKADREAEGPTSAAHFREQRRLADNIRISNSDSPFAVAAALAFNEAPEPRQPKKQVDRIAEAWGMHEPEPYEEFFGGGGGAAPTEDSSAASSVKNGLESHNGRFRRARDGREIRDQVKEYLDEGRPQPTRRTTARGNIPPPQPIFVPGATMDDMAADGGAMNSPPLSSPTASGAPKRSKSIMQKFRKMRDAPNVPVEQGYEEGGDPSPPSSVENYNQDAYYGSGAMTDGGGRTARPTHRQQNSFFGRFGRGTSANPGPTTAEYSPTNDQFVYVEKSSNKALPPRPPPTVTPGAISEKEDYFSGPVSPGSPNTPGNGLGRKASLMKKVRGVVRATNK